MTRQTQVLISSYMKTGSKSMYRVMSLHTEGQHERYDMNIRLCKNYTKVTRGDAVRSGRSGIVLYGDWDIVFGAKRSNQWTQWNSGIWWWEHCLWCKNVKPADVVE